ncbi:VpsF family polysaccharide biosynthesis protein [Methylobacterium sp. sgz302541]|uniref:VpsF family polysaccharide biosynthesis protein n=1 Tax=unclassified Methylobacterium TaxID=2615210 RepID=UPI003D355F3D
MSLGAGLRGEVPFSRAAPRRSGLASRIETLGLYLLAVLVLGVSGGMLWTIGLNYEGLTGSAPQKIHPSTYLAVLLLGWVMLRAGNPVAYAARAVRTHPASVLIAACGVVLLLLIAARGGAGLAGSIDTFVLPGLVIVLMADRDAPTMRRLEWLVHAVMLANAVLGLVELASGQRFFPFRLDGQVFETDTRSAALQGHPLANATMTACYVLMLVTGGGTLSPVKRIAMIGVQLVALVTFGGRSATVIALVFGAAYAFIPLHRTLISGRIPILGAAALVFLVTLVPIGIGALAATGFFDALMARFVSDGGSAAARVGMFSIFDRLTLGDIVVGPDLQLVESLRRIEGLEWGIENPIIHNVLYHGAFMTGVEIVAITLFLREVAKACRPGLALPIIAFVILVNGFESLGGKTTMLAKFALMLLVLYRPAVESRIRAAASSRARR